jgi:SAM-dependent methyltransferase
MSAWTISARLRKRGYEGVQAPTTISRRKLWDCSSVTCSCKSGRLSPCRGVTYNGVASWRCHVTTLRQLDLAGREPLCCNVKTFAEAKNMRRFLGLHQIAGIGSQLKRRLTRLGHHLGLYPSARPRVNEDFQSATYWEKHYAAGGNSGPGSYGKHAEFKAEVINRFVKEQGVVSVVEFGCGDGNQLLLAEYPFYTGLDVSPCAVDLCRTKFANDRSKTFALYEPAAFLPKKELFHADLALSLDVVYHLVEDDVYEAYMRDLFQSATRFVIVFSSNLAPDLGEPTPIERLAPHCRFRKFSKWISANAPNWRLDDVIPNRFPYDPGPPSEGSLSGCRSIAAGSSSAFVRSSIISAATTSKLSSTR